LGLYRDFWNLHDQPADAVLVLYLPSEREYSPTKKGLHEGGCYVHVEANVAQDLGANIFTGLNCTPNPVFVPHPYTISLHSYTRTFFIKPIQFHMLIFATFASLIAPFGGFFASGLKRTFKIKDFGDSIPGHGGITDRMDCQFIMGFFAFMYYQSFIAVYKASVGSVLEVAIQGLSGEEQLEVIKGLAKHLVNQGVVTENLLQCFSGVPTTKR
jgi:phosphatidate cytidylyltransferase